MLVCQSHNKRSENKTNQLPPGRTKQDPRPGHAIMKDRETQRAKQDIESHGNYRIAFHHRTSEKDKQGLERERTGTQGMEIQAPSAIRLIQAAEYAMIRDLFGSPNIVNLIKNDG